MMQSNSSIEDVFRIRKLEISDKDNGFIELLRQLTVCDSVSDEKFKERFEEIAKYGDDHRICVIEDVRLGKIVATGSVFIEKKFVRNCGKAGHIEDVVVDSSARGMQLGKRIVEYLADHAYSMGCYKELCSSAIFKSSSIIMDAPNEVSYKPPPEFEEIKKDSLVNLNITDSTELWLIQWPFNQVNHMKLSVVKRRNQMQWSFYLLSLSQKLLANSHGVFPLSITRSQVSLYRTA
ncbi:hypothetical protein K7X08_014177 [Anisodus acutangulus]|uniref:Glucosamine 6-phosphate N-acetyltransferase n=1 Tax=Anisodus acutangulus TaxID=402998 RepID=A0A9Q1LHY7_9SOLA|nr:hypothetical protein K7X08_014177 [Anisodus acutangulus]